jgi:uncharacterized damage-inducible protein DinB
MNDTKLPEVWLRGPLPEITPYLQPIAHALLQAREEIIEITKDFPEHLLWERPAGVASVGFHLQHLSGVLDRLFTYAKGGNLTEEQLRALKAESNPDAGATLQQMLEAFHRQVDAALEQLKATGENSLKEFRGVGRKQLPSTVLGLMAHAAEHTMRHTGQLLVTATFVKHELKND